MEVNDSFTLRDICGKYFLMPVKRNNIGNDPILLNDTGAFIWKKAEENLSSDEIVNLILQEYPSENHIQIAEAVRAFVEEMMKAGIFIA